MRHRPTRSTPSARSSRFAVAIYDDVLPAVDKRFKALDSQMRCAWSSARRCTSGCRSSSFAPRPDFLATADERVLHQQLAQLSEHCKNDTSAAGSDARQRIKRLQGVMHWNIRTTYGERLTHAYKHLHELDADVERLNTIYRSFVLSRQASTQSYKGYDNQMRAPAPPGAGRPGRGCHADGATGQHARSHGDP